MKFQKGQSGNPAGRPKGSSNKDVKELRERISQLLDSQFDQVVEDLAHLDPKDRIKAYTDLIEYALPKLSRTDITSGGEKIGNPFSDWSEEEINKELDRLRKQQD